jgi:hypothetical protein
VVVFDKQTRVLIENVINSCIQSSVAARETETPGRAKADATNDGAEAVFGGNAVSNQPRGAGTGTRRASAGNEGGDGDVDAASGAVLAHRAAPVPTQAMATVRLQIGSSARADTTII